jgi:hypothetical protein
MKYAQCGYWAHSFSLKILGKSYAKSSKALFAAQGRVNKMNKATISVPHLWTEDQSVWSQKCSWKRFHNRSGRNSAHHGKTFTSKQQVTGLGVLPSPFRTRRIRDRRSFQGK